MRPWRVTAVLLLTSFVLVGCFFPGLLDVYRQQFRPPTITPTKADLDAALRRDPNDPQMNFAYAITAAQRWWSHEVYQSSDYLKKQYGSDKPETGWEPTAAYARAIQCANGDPAPYLFDAVFLLWNSDASSSDSTGKSLANWHPAPRTPQQRRALEQAASLLAETVARDPGNAFPRYLLAYSDFARGDDSGAWREIARAEQCPRWTRYEDKAGQALWGAMRAAGMSPLYAPVYAADACERALIMTGTPLRALGRLMAAQAAARREAGDDAGALERCRSLLLLARTMRLRAANPLELLVGEAILPMATGPLLSSEARQGLSGVSFEQRHEAQAEAFAAYARAHGEAALGEQAVTETQAFNAAHSRITAGFARLRTRPTARLETVALVILRQMPYQAAVLLVALAVCALVLLAVRLGGRKPMATAVSTRLWAGALGCLLLVPTAGALWYTMGVSAEVTQEMQGFYWVMVLGLACLSGVVWLVAMGVAVHGRMRALRAGAPNQMASGAATLASTVLPTVAAQVLFAVLVLLILYLVALHDSHLSLQIINQGELHALGLR